MKFSFFSKKINYCYNNLAIHLNTFIYFVLITKVKFTFSV